RQKLGKRKRDFPEIKGNLLPFPILEYALNKISTAPLISTAVYVEKNNTYGRIRQSPAQRKRHYNYIVRNAIQNTVLLLPKTQIKLKIEMDRYHANKIDKMELQTYLYHQIGPYVENIVVSQTDSMGSPAIQIADLIAYSVNKYLLFLAGIDTRDKAKTAYYGVSKLIDRNKLKIIKLY
ncbi:MAG: DUF3800 domain-containing protein, partial [Candidatus Diapherotrites archaeon]|nr:DUF3800 domain-containing protein [Candidatus Diapherotrites archaeon]